MTSRLLTPIERLLSHVEFDTVGGCWLWDAYCDPKGGYGRFVISKRSWLAHRASWVLHKGPIPDGLDVLHWCDTPPCINPAHLFLGDDFVNQQDRVAKGRHAGVARPQDGSANKMAKLTEDDVRIIRASVRKVLQTDLSARFGVHVGTISGIQNRKTWTHI